VAGAAGAVEAAGVDAGDARSVAAGESAAAGVARGAEHRAPASAAIAASASAARETAGRGHDPRRERVRVRIYATVFGMTSSRAWFLVHPEGLAVRRDGDRVELPNDDDAAALGLTAARAHDVGVLDDGTPGLAAAIGNVPMDTTLKIAKLWELYPSLGDTRFMMAGRASQIVDWAETHRFCGRCATPTQQIPTERCMRCPRCGLLGYPRISPAVIVLVRRGDEALLARGARFPGVFYSTLAGFVEIGESLEETIAREVREEVGIEIKTTRYFGSQPWPFPHSLMVGYFAEWAGGEIRPDGDEILDAKWFRAGELPVIPPGVSIARRLIDAWIADVAQSS
jgi:NAD+ diphosphatase